MPEKVLLKDILFNRDKVEQIAREIVRVYPAFEKGDFVRGVVREFPRLELKARITCIADRLKTHLPADYRRASGILIDALPAPNDPSLSDDDFGDFIYAAYAEFIARNGCVREHLDFSFQALYQVTQRFSAEDAIRYFLNAFPVETIRALESWAGDRHYHVRRLCSEGMRPKLPWSQKINIPVDAPLPVLDRLFSDKTRFVTRSVANHVNDISKISPDLAIGTLQRWRKSGKQKPAEMDYITRHALRTLIKEGNPKALALLGFSHSPKVRVSDFNVPKTVRLDRALEFSFRMEARKNTRVIVDYILYFRNKAGKLGGGKVFKLNQLALEKGGSVTVSKKHMMRAQMTTRTLYPGDHEIEIQVNGKVLAKAGFKVKTH